MESNDNIFKIVTNYHTIRIYFDDTLYMLINRKYFIGIQSWIEGGDRFCIEFYTHNTSILTEFDCIKKWKMLLEEIDKNLTI